MKKIFLAAFSLTLFFSNIALGDEAALQFAKSRQQAISSSSKPGLEIDKTLDYESLVRNSMGANWDLATESQKRDIDISLRSIIRTSLERRLKKVKSKSITWSSSEDKTEDLSIVRSVVDVTRPVAEQFEIDYVVLKKSEGYKVIDVIFDGVSTVETYRRQFQRIIKSRGVSTLVEKLKERVSQNLIDDDDGC